MEPLPLLLSVLFLVVWFLSAGLMPEKYKGTQIVAGFALSLLQLASSIWAAFLIFSYSIKVSWYGVWFKITSSSVFGVHLSFDKMSVILWVLFSLFVSVMAYLSVSDLLKSSKKQAKGELLGLPLLALGMLITIVSGNFIFYYIGWAIVSFATYLCITFNAPNIEERASTAFRYLIVSVFSLGLFFCGILGIYVSTGSLDFIIINELKISMVPSWAVICLIVGIALQVLQVPIIRNVRYLAEARTPFFPVFFLGNLFLSATLFIKIYPVILVVENIQFFALLPGVAMVAVALMLLPERDPAKLVGWLASHISLSILLSGIAGHYQAAQAFAINGGFAVFLFACVLHAVKVRIFWGRWAVALATLLMVGLPVTGLAWARYLQYLGLIQMGISSPDQHIRTLEWVLLGFQVLSDLMVGMALWGFVRDFWRDESSSISKQQANKRWDLAILVGILCVMGISVLIGGRPLSGVAGVFNQDHSYFLGWFEKLIPVATRPEFYVIGSLQLVGTQVDMIARGMLVGVFVLPVVLANLWVFRDDISSESFKSGLNGFLEKTALKTSEESIFWDGFLRPASRYLGSVADFFDQSVIDHALYDIWGMPIDYLKKGIVAIEAKFIDKKLVDGSSVLVGSLGKALRLLHTGNVQFYFGIGLILIAIIIAKFVYLGG